MQVNLQNLTLTIAAAVIMAVAGVAWSPGNAAAQDEDLPSFADVDGDGVSDAMDVCPDTVIPEQAVPRRRLIEGRYALTDDDTVFNTGRQKRRHGRGESDYTLADTRGCSCEQIIEMSGLGRNHRRFGCSQDVMRVFIATMDALPTVQEVTFALGEQCQSEPTGELTRESENPILY